MSKADEYRAKALAAELLMQKTVDPIMRASYGELAKGWFELARNAEWLLAQGGSGPPPPEEPGPAC